MQDDGARLRAVLGCQAEAAGKADCKFRSWLSFVRVGCLPPYPHPNPSPGGRGAQVLFAPGVFRSNPQLPAFPNPQSPISNPDSRIPNPQSPIPIPESRFPNPRPQITRNVIAFNTARVRSRVPSFSRMVET
ncbi:hypothetical protein XabCFBP2524_19575 [Xanthomonas axonopodis pv. begoniae]|nr:hypothetical protein XabCFBP2524_19575 [Xanthomonas axonopodis pv. begoniae]